MYRFQVRQRGKLTRTDAERASVKDPNGNINAIEALALASEAKGQMNGIIANVIHESLEHAAHAADNPPPSKPAPSTEGGIENPAYVQEQAQAKAKDA